MKLSLSNLAKQTLLPLMMLGAATATTAVAQPAFVTPLDLRLIPATVTTLSQEGFPQVYIDGYIHKATVAAVAKALAGNVSSYGIVYFNSAGGDLAAAEELGRLIRQHGFATQIGRLSSDKKQIRRGVCESACPIAFIGGKFRLLDTDTGKLGVHRFYLAKQGRWAEDSKLLFTSERDLRAYIQEMGISDEFFSLVMKTPPEMIQHVGIQAIYDWKLGTGSEFTSWSVAPGGAVTGLADTSTGGLAITLECQNASPVLTAKFKPWFPPAALMGYDQHSISADGIRYPVAKAEASYDRSTGFIAFKADVSSEAAIALRTAGRLGYTLSSESAPGEYSRSLSVTGDGSAIQSLLDSCPTKGKAL